MTTHRNEERKGFLFCTLRCSALPGSTYHPVHTWFVLGKVVSSG